MSHSLAKSLRLDEDVEVDLLQLLHKHAKHIWRCAEVSQVVHYQVEQQLRAYGKDNRSTHLYTHSCISTTKATYSLCYNIMFIENKSSEFQNYSD